MNNESKSLAPFVSAIRFTEPAHDAQLTSQPSQLPGRPNQSYPIPKKQNRFRPSAKTLRNTRAFPGRRLIHGPIIRDKPFKRLIESALRDYQPETNLRINSPAIKFLETIAESYLINLFENTYSATLHARRTSIKPSDVVLARKLRGKIIIKLSYAP